MATTAKIAKDIKLDVIRRASQSLAGCGRGR